MTGDAARCTGVYFVTQAVSTFSTLHAPSVFYLECTSRVPPPPVDRPTVRALRGEGPRLLQQAAQLALLLQRGEARSA